MTSSSLAARRGAVPEHFLRDADELRSTYGVRVPDATRLGDDELRVLADETGDLLDEAPAEDVIAWARLAFGRRLIVLASMADGVVAHLAARAAPGVDVGFLDTGLHFIETLATRDAIAATLPINVISARPAVTLDHQGLELGPDLWDRDPDRCCQIRKVEPLSRLLAPYRAWATGVRRDESDTRAHTRVVAWDGRRRMVKVNPIARLSSAEVDAYAARHGVLVNPLRQLGYTSIGCAPCTRPVAEGEPERAGRWRGVLKSECGIHA